MLSPLSKVSVYQAYVMELSLSSAMHCKLMRLSVRGRELLVISRRMGGRRGSENVYWVSDKVLDGQNGAKVGKGSPLTLMAYGYSLSVPELSSEK